MFICIWTYVYDVHMCIACVLMYVLWYIFMCGIRVCNIIHMCVYLYVNVYMCICIWYVHMYTCVYSVHMYVCMLYAHVCLCV